MKNFRHFAYQQYKRYCLADGSEHIASEFALFRILKIIDRYDVKKVLEVGVGIGTISGSILEYCDLTGKEIECHGTEANAFCLNQIPLNLGGNTSNLKIYSSLQKISEKEKFDLIIIDGSEKDLRKIKERIQTRGVILIEGDRRNQVEIVKEIFPKSKYVQLISLRRNGEYSVKKSDDFQGGLKIIYSEPSTKQWVDWSLNKFATKLRFLLRRNLIHGQ